MYRLAAGTFVFAFLATFAPVDAVSSADVGSTADLAAIRRDLPILMSAEVQYVQPLVIEWVVTDGRRAMASWVASPFRGFATLAKRERRWWWTGETVGGPGGFWTNLTAPPQDLGRCFDAIQATPSAKAVFDDGYIDKSTYMLLRGRWKTAKLTTFRFREEFCGRVRAERLERQLPPPSRSAGWCRRSAIRLRGPRIATSHRSSPPKRSLRFRSLCPCVRTEEAAYCIIFVQRRYDAMGAFRAR